MDAKITYDEHGNALRACWKCGEKNGVHRVRCVECDAHRSMAWVAEVKSAEKGVVDAELVS